MLVVQPQTWPTWPLPERALRFDSSGERLQSASGLAAYAAGAALTISMLVRPIGLPPSSSAGGIYWYCGAANGDGFAIRLSGGSGSMYWRAYRSTTGTSAAASLNVQSSWGLTDDQVLNNWWWLSCTTRPTGQANVTGAIVFSASNLTARRGDIAYGAGSGSSWYTSASIMAIGNRQGALSTVYANGDIAYCCVEEGYGGLLTRSDNPLLYGPGATGKGKVLFLHSGDTRYDYTRTLEMVDYGSSQVDGPPPWVLGR